MSTYMISIRFTEAEFQNFHRLLCERFGYVHDEKDWKRDQVSLIEWIARRVSGEPEGGAVTLTQQQFDALRVALEVIAVGDSKTPSDTAAHGLVSAGFWTAALETANSDAPATAAHAGATLTERVVRLFQPWPDGELGPTDEPESQYRFGYNTAIEDVMEIIGGEE